MANNEFGAVNAGASATVGLDVLDDYLVDVSLRGVHGSPGLADYSARIRLQLPVASERWILRADTHLAAGGDEMPGQEQELHVTIWQGWPVSLLDQDALAILHEFAVCAYDWTGNATDGWSSMLARDLAVIARGRNPEGLSSDAAALLDRFRTRVPPRFCLPLRCVEPSRGIAIPMDPPRP